jgi:hypothetical protein
MNKNKDLFIDTLINIIISFITSIIIFGIYVEVNPKMTNIWYRLNSNGVKEIRFGNLFELMKGPLKYDFYWYPQYFDINYFIYLGITFIIIHSIN